MNQPIFDKDLILRYQRSGPRYTSYPTIVNFCEGFNEKHYIEMAAGTNKDMIPAPLSLYFHLPFCSRVCFYCACNKIITRNTNRATLYLENLYREIRLQSRLFDHDRIVEQLHWGGGTPTFIGHDNIRELMTVIKENFTLRDDDKGDYSIEIDPREVDEEAVLFLREMGFNRLSIGIQDFNIDVQKAVNRIQSFEEAERIMHAAREAGFLSVNVDLIYGLPKQTLETFSGTLELLSELNPDRIAIYNYAHMPEIFKTQRQIREEDLPDAGTKLEILQHTINYLDGKDYLYIGMDHFARHDDELAIAQQQGNLHRNFQGYSTHADCDIIGMGVTAISRIGHSYAQNVHSLDEYEQLVMNNKVPVFRGIKLDNDDLLRRDVITRLICNFYLRFQDVEDTHNIDFVDYFYDELILLEEMEKDGLLTVGSNEIRVSPRGRLLVRNICMVFDKYLQSARPAGKFSRVI
ncbi:MAG TPA: oxygen-independent coproporphyrinogen III oxidase [Gammaproteobacteria bacterium]|nr:oxygen-independent coproporphyrinogen III oxidase [Gammaproteobacteria bacterium]